MKYFSLILICFSLIACSDDDNGGGGGDGTKKAGGGPQARQVAEAKTTSGFIADGQGGLFNNVQWYTQEASTDRIQSHYDVYGIRSAGQLYKLQILSYYNPNDSQVAGYYTLRVETRGEAVRIVEVDTSADQSVFTYVDLNDDRVWSMSEAEAKEDTSWEIGFKGTEIILNSGASGPGDTVGTLLYRNQKLFKPDGNADADLLQSFKDGGAPDRVFNETEISSTASFYPPDGVNRVIDESRWYVEENGVREPNSQNWWLVRSIEGRSYAKIHPVAIVAAEEGDKVEVIFEYFTQGRNEASFTANPKNWALEFNPNTEVFERCLDFETAAEVDCRADTNLWDLKFVAVPSAGGTSQGQWRVFTNNGAIGPLTQQEALEIVFWEEAI